MIHEDSGFRCAVAHKMIKDGVEIILPQCILCTCTLYIPAEDWEKHLKKFGAKDDNEKNS